MVSPHCFEFVGTEIVADIEVVVVGTEIVVGIEVVVVVVFHFVSVERLLLSISSL